MKKLLELTAITVCTSALLLSGCSKSEDPAKINSDNHKNSDVKKSDNKKQHKAKKDDKPLTEKINDNNKKAESHKTTLKLDNVINEIDVLHNFIVKDSNFYTDMQKDLASEGIKLADNYSSPYIDNANPPDMDQAYSFAGIIDKKDVKKEGDNKAIVTYHVKSGISSAQYSDGKQRDMTKVGNAVKDKLAHDKAYKNAERVVKYEVTLNKDKTVAVVKKLTKGDWSI